MKARFHCRSCDRILINGDWVRPADINDEITDAGASLSCRYCVMEMTLSNRREIIDKLRLRPIDIAHPLLTIPAHLRVTEAARTMTEGKTSILGCLRDEKLVGILTEQDITRRMAAKNLHPLETRVETLMSSPILTLHEDKTLAEAIVEMALAKTRHLIIPRVDGQHRVLSSRNVSEALLVVIGEAYGLGLKHRE